MIKNSKKAAFSNTYRSIEVNDLYLFNSKNSSLSQDVIKIQNQESSEKGLISYNIVQSGTKKEQEVQL